MTFRYRHRKQIIMCLTIVILLSASVTSLYFFLPKKERKEKGEMIITKNLSKTSKNKKNSIIKNEAKEEKEKHIMIDIKGEVVGPGIYELEENSRVIDAINKAGGTTKNADTSVLNLSKKLKDEMVIIVYSYYEVENFKLIKEEESKIQKECVKGVNGVSNDGCIDDSSIENSSNQKISINEATVEELMTLSGLGEGKAKAIIEYREKNGPFQSIEDLLKVKGIGDSVFAKIKENITL